VLAGCKGKHWGLIAKSSISIRLNRFIIVELHFSAGHLILLRKVLAILFHHMKFHNIRHILRYCFTHKKFLI
jgi:hypothetical protein